jgi:hypothetical protein
MEAMPSPATPKPLKMPQAPFPALQEEGLMLYAAVFWLAVGVALLGVALEALTDYRVVGYVFLLFVLALGCNHRRSSRASRRHSRRCSRISRVSPKPSEFSRAVWYSADTPG